LCTHVYAENCEHRHDQDIIATSIKTLLPEATDNKPQNESKEGIIFFFSDSAIMPNRQKLVDVLEHGTRAKVVASTTPGRSQARHLGYPYFFAAL
jgi:hypothetical protein